MSRAVPIPSKIELPRMRMPSPGAAALSNAPMPYTTRPTVKQRLRPQRSVSLPPGIINAAMTSRKMVIATWMPWTVVSRSWLMSLIITFMLVPAKLQMNWASASGTSTCRNAADGRPAVPASATSHLPPHESERHSTPGYAEVSGGGLAPTSGPLAFLLVDHGLDAHNGLHPMEVISSGRANGPLGKARMPAGSHVALGPQLPPGRDPLALSSDSVRGRKSNPQKGPYQWRD